jgi:hypothetical protein
LISLMYTCLGVRKGAWRTLRSSLGRVAFSKQKPRNGSMYTALYDLKGSQSDY